MIDSLKAFPEVHTYPGVYFLATVRPYVAQTGQRRKTASIYVGYSDNIARRFQQHLQGKGSDLTRAWLQTGHTFHLAKVLPGATRDTERRIRKSGHYSDWLSGKRKKVRKPRPVPSH